MKKIKKKLNGILYEGGYGDFSLNSGLTKNNPHIERKKRAGLAYLLATNPETFEIIANKNVNLFHGTNINALPNILKYGMNSVDELSKIGVTVSTGESWSRIEGKRSFISFTDDIDTAIDYASLHPTQNKLKESSFGVLIGISSEYTDKLKRCTVHSDLPEVGFMNNVPLEYIKVIAVPKDKVKFVSKLVNNDEITVTSIDLDEKFYYIDLMSWDITFDKEKAKELVERQNQNNTNTSFDAKSIKKLTEGRKTSGILDIYKKIKEKFNSRGKIYEQSSRD